MKPRRSITELLKAQVVELCCTVVCVRSLKSHLASACVAPAHLALSTYASQDAFLRAPLTDMQRSTALAALVCKSSSLIVSYRSAMTWKPQQVKRPCYNVRDVDVTLTCDTHRNSAWYRPRFWWLKFHLLNCEQDWKYVSKGILESQLNISAVCWSRRYLKAHEYFTEITRINSGFWCGLNIIFKPGPCDIITLPTN